MKRGEGVATNSSFFVTNVLILFLLNSLLLKSIYYICRVIMKLKTTS